MTRVAALAFLLLVSLAAAAAPEADGAWERGRVVPAGSPLPVPPPEVEAIASVTGGPVRVRLPGGREVTVPGSEGGRAPAVALGGGATVALSWETSETCGGEGGGKSTPCGGSVFASVWRLGDDPPPGQVLHEPEVVAGAPRVGVGDDGTVLVGFEEIANPFFGDPSGVRAAVGRAGAPFEPARLAPRGVIAGGVQRIRGVPQLGWLDDGAGGGTGVMVADAVEGRLRPPRREATLDRYGEARPSLLRSGRGDRLLLWKAGRGSFRVRTGAAGRRLGPARSLAAIGASAALGEAGDFAVLSRGSSRAVQRLGVLRGRTTARRVWRERLEPPGGSPSGGVGTAMAVDARGRTFILHDTPVGRHRARLLLGVAGHSAARGRPFAPGRVLSSRRRRAYCDAPDLHLLAPGRALARWGCRTRTEPSAAFTEQARYRPER